jgi:hypothetical protein
VFKQDKKQRPTLIDRFAVGFLNLLVSLPTGILLWAVLNGYPIVTIPWLPAEAILWFTGAMVLLGVLMQDVLFLNIYSKCWNILYYWFRGY